MGENEKGSNMSWRAQTAGRARRSRKREGEILSCHITVENILYKAVIQTDGNTLSKRLTLLFVEVGRIANLEI